MIIEPAPAFCDERTDLFPFFRQAIERAKQTKDEIFVSVTIETTYSDPLAVVEKIHLPNDPLCYFEKPSSDFAIACGEFIAESTFDGSERFHKAKNWADIIFGKTLVAGDHQRAGTGPTLCLLYTSDAADE